MTAILSKIRGQFQNNPKTSIAGLVVILSAIFPKYTAIIATLAAGTGLILSKDGDTGASKETARTDKAVEQVEALNLPAPPVGVK